MQGHPEAPWLWKKHKDAILCGLGLTPMVHEPCLYSGTIEGNWIVFKIQVDNFAIAAPDECTANILLDMIDDKLSIPLKRQGLLDMFNGINVTQTKYYININCHTYIDKFCKKYQATWLNKVPVNKNRPTPLPTDTTWIKKFNAAIGSTDPTKQHKLATKMQIRYKGGMGELIWAMTTCRPDIAFTSVKLSQSNSAPAEHHYHGLKHAIRYLCITRYDGLYFWRAQPCKELPIGPLPVVNSNKQDLLLDSQPTHDACTAVAYGDSDKLVCSATFISNSRVPPLLTKPNFSLLLPYPLPRPNSWLHAPMSDRCVSLSAVYCGTLTFLKRQLLLHTKTTMDVQQWVMHKNPPCKRNILTSSILLSVVGWNANSLSLDALTCLSILPITSPKFYHVFYFIDMLIFF
jgi:hypothetical protein